MLKIFSLIPFLFHLSLQFQDPENRLTIDDEFLREILEKRFAAKKDVEYRISELPVFDRLLPAGDSTIDLSLLLEPSRIRLRLKRNSFSPRRDLDFAYLIRGENTSRIVEEEIGESYDCFYVHDENGVKASIDVCDGFKGIVFGGDGFDYFIEPLPSKYQANSSGKSGKFHLIKKINSTRGEKAEMGRIKRSSGSKKDVKIETAIFVDRDLYRHVTNNFPENTEKNLFRFVLAMINAVQLLYHDDSLGFKVTFVLKRLEIFHADPPRLQRSHDIDRYLSNFCAWQEKENESWEKSSLHWDHALMLTGIDLYAIAKTGKFSNQVLGLAPVAGMCKPSSSCTVNEGLHFESVYVVAHEIGHNLGMRHDGPSADNDCDPSSHIMSPTLGSGKNSWSTCSKQYLSQFLQSPQARCLFETTNFELDHTEGGTLPGERFDSNLQCKLRYGKQSERSQTQREEEICRDLRCTRERYTWTSHPALEGTECGADKWCRFGRCVNRGQREMTGTKKVDGAWSDWSPFSECASACLLPDVESRIGNTGISIASRICNDPRPENGGRYCSGNSKRYRTCNAQQCSNVHPITIKEFAEQICRRAREFDKNLIGLGFQRNSSDAEEACAVWCYQFNGGAKNRGWIFPDGTPCYSNRFTSNPMFCVSGRCEEFFCFPTNRTEFVATGEDCRGKLTQIKISESGWKPVGPCRYSCVTPGTGLRVVKRGTERNIQLCQPMKCSKKRTLLEFATDLCTRYRSRVKKLSGLGIQLSATLEDPDRSCHVACQDSEHSHRFYLVTGEDGRFPSGSDCSRGNSGKKAFCVSGKCLEFEKNNLPAVKSKLTFFNVRRKRSLELRNKTVTALLDSVAVDKLIDELKKGDKIFLKSSPSQTIDFDNPVYLPLNGSTNWSNLNGTSNLSGIT